MYTIKYKYKLIKYKGVLRNGKLGNIEALPVQ